MLLRRIKPLGLTILLLTLAMKAHSQCVGLPAVSALGSNRFPVGICAPVTANVTYNVSFISPVPAGKVELVYDWSDGNIEHIPLTPGLTVYSGARNHTFPAASDCEYVVTITLYHNDIPCTATRQIQKVPSWRRDNANGGEVTLISPVTKEKDHLVCEGEPINIAFSDESYFNCTSTFIQTPPDFIQTPNTETRWQQIVYNTNGTGRRIPNLTVNGVPVTDQNGNSTRSNYQDPRGIHEMSAPVVWEDPRRRPTLTISAPGGFDAQSPKAGDVFAVTLRYWNFCNPYDDPTIPGPPQDLINGDHPPVESVSYIRIVPAPAAPTAIDETSCSGTTPPPFSVSGVPAGSTIFWYAANSQTGEPGSLINSGTSTSLPVTSHPQWKNNSTPGVYKVWASYKQKGGSTCESKKTLVTRSIREALTVASPIQEIPTELCNNNTFTIVLPEPKAEVIGGETEYVWTAPSGTTLVSSTSNSATFNAAITAKTFGSALYVDRKFTVARRYKNDKACGVNSNFNVRIYRAPVGGTLSGGNDLCEGSELSAINLSGHVGQIRQWEFSKDGAPYQAITHTSVSSMPGVLQPGVYTFRVLVENGACALVHSNEKTITIFKKPAQINAGTDQFICTELKSAPIGASTPSVGSGTWSYVGSVPVNLPEPSFSDKTNPNATITITAANPGAYILRWTVSNGLCESFDDVVVDFGTTPSDPDAGHDSEACGPATALNAKTPLKGTGAWSVVSGPNGCSDNSCGVTFANPSSPTTSVSIPENALGSYTFRWTLSSGGKACFSKYDDVSVTFRKAVVVQVTDPDPVCLSSITDTEIPLQAIIQGEYTAVVWTVVDGAGSIHPESTTGVAQRAVYTSNATDYTGGSPIRIKIEITPKDITACSVAAQIITIQTDRKPIAELEETAFEICESKTVLNAKTPPYNAIGTWTSSNPSVVISDKNNPKATAENLPEGTTSFTWSVTSASGTCTSEEAILSIRRNTLPPASNISIEACASTSDDIAVVSLKSYENQVTTLPPAERTITWYNASGTTQLDATNYQVRHGESVIARIASSSSQCTNDATVTVSVVRPPQVTPMVMELCEDNAGSNYLASVDLNKAGFTEGVTQENGVSIHWFHTREDATNNASAISSSIAVNQSKTVTARVTSNAAPYCYSLADVVVKTKARPQLMGIAGREEICQAMQNNGSDTHTEIFQVTPMPGATYHWEVPNDASSQFKVFGGGKPSDFYVMLQFPNVYNGTIAAKVEVNGCVSDLVTKNVSVVAAPSAPVIIGSSFICGNEQSIPYRVTPNNYPSSTYNWEVRRVSDGTPGGGYITDGQSTGNVLVNFNDEDVMITVRESNAICVSPPAVKVITRSNPIKATAHIKSEVSCSTSNDGVIETTVDGGTFPMASFELIDAGSSAENSNGTFPALSAGAYVIKVVDANGCTATTNPVLLQSPAPVRITSAVALADASGNHFKCVGDTDGKIELQFEGGRVHSTYKISLTSPSNLIERTVYESSPVTIDNLPAGIYTAIVSDDSGCTSQPAYIELRALPPFVAGFIGNDQAMCSGTTPAVLKEATSTTGATGLFAFQWQRSATNLADDEASWETIPGATSRDFQLEMIINNGSNPIVNYYRRIVTVKSIDGSVCKIAGKDNIIRITTNPLPVVMVKAMPAEVCFDQTSTIHLDVTSARSPVHYTYALNDESFSTTTSLNSSIPLTNMKAGVAFTLQSLTDANGCAPNEIPSAININVLNGPVDFTIFDDEDECNSTFTFTWDQTSGTSYRWEWGDGTKEEVHAAGSSSRSQPKTITHTFTGASDFTQRIYTVRLFAMTGSCPEQVMSKEVVVPPAVVINFAAEKYFCSGEQIIVNDMSTGLEKGSWYLINKDTKQRTLLASWTGMPFSFNAPSESAVNNYELELQGTNPLGCTSEKRIPITVFNTPSAEFNAEVVKPFSGTSALVSIENKSTPDLSGNYQFAWDYGDHREATLNNASAYTIAYPSTGSKTISMVASNILAEASGKICKTSQSKTVNIGYSGLTAEFEATPLTACGPADIIVKNLSVGADRYEWKLSDAAGIVATSGLDNPTFTIVKPGKYLLSLTTFFDATSGSAQSDVQEIEIFSSPVTSFELRDKVYTGADINLLNYTTGADGYHWDFGNGITSALAEPDFAYAEPGEYRVTLTALSKHNGLLSCSTQFVRNITVLPGGSIDVPNAFTPNTHGSTGGVASTNGINDIFLPRVEGAAKFHLQIFDRWGSLIFESKDKDIGWDGYSRSGTLLPAGVYVYKLQVDLNDGHRHTRFGDITLIR